MLNYQIIGNAPFISFFSIFGEFEGSGGLHFLFLELFKPLFGLFGLNILRRVNFGEVLDLGNLQFGSRLGGGWWPGDIRRLGLVEDMVNVGLSEVLWWRRGLGFLLLWPLWGPGAFF